jgi:microsomal dipeptidase-like Zn-dependent dipeptidase
MKLLRSSILALCLIEASLTTALGADTPQTAPTAAQPARVPRAVVAPDRTAPVIAPAPVAAPTPAPTPLLKPVLIPMPVQMPYTGLKGWADLHTHPMIHLAFGGKLIYGAPDLQTQVPTNHACQNMLPAGSLPEALGDDRPTHGGHDFLHFPCGDEIRRAVIGELQKGNSGALTTVANSSAPAAGFPTFNTWPAWNDITHQKMWWEWIKRARDGGLRVMVALATNNRTLADSVVGPGDMPTDDVSSADLQLDNIRMFVARHSDFMAIAYSSADLKTIVESNRIAVVLGAEIDNIGNLNQYRFNPEPQLYGMAVSAIQHLYDKGVRYIFPIHVTDNVFGGTAIYQPMFNVANFREMGHFWQVECSIRGDGIDGRYPGGGLGLETTIAAMVKLRWDPRNQPPVSPGCPQPGHPEQGVGHRNAQGLTSVGALAIMEMMRRGMIIDIDHMSHRAVEQALTIAERNDYPVNSGHSCIRIGSSNMENCRSTEQLHRIAALHGMFGLGTDGVHAYTWSRQYQAAMNYMGYKHDAAYKNGAIAFGTDLNGLVKGPPPGNAGTINRVAYSAQWPMSSFPGTPKSWNYNTEGVAHYGMLPDFIMDVRTSPVDPNLGNAPDGPYGVSGQDLVDNHLQRSADYFWHMWEQSEARKTTIH